MAAVSRFLCPLIKVNRTPMLRAVTAGSDPKRSSLEGRDSAFDLARVAYVDRAHLHAQRLCHGLDDAELTDASGYGRIPNDGRACDARCDLLEQLQPFSAQGIFELQAA